MILCSVTEIDAAVYKISFHVDSVIAAVDAVVLDVALVVVVGIAHVVTTAAQDADNS